MQNQVTIFSNGLADYRKVIPLKKGEPTQVRIPVNKQDVGDVLASLAIFGDVKYTPPTFAPSNDQDGTLDLNPNDVLKQFARQLRGSKATVKTSGGNTIMGLVAGLNDEPEIVGEMSIGRSSLILSVGGSFQKVEIQDIKEWSFDDEQVQIEIDKALQRSFQNIKPHSTFVESTLSTEKDEEKAVVQYTTSAAAWKITYRLRRIDGKVYFEGFAVVDNNTEQDWEDVIVSVVVGEPISFRTDLAHVTVPYRNMVQIVQNQVVGAVEAEEAMNFANITESIPSNVSMPVGSMRSLSSPMGAGGITGGMSAAFGSNESEKGFGGRSATQPQVNAKEIGDYCVFQSTETVTIRSKRSALVPVFSAEIPEDKSNIVLYYKPSQHPQRAYRTIAFENTLDHSLGRGVCTFYDNGVMAGTAIMPATKLGQDQLLPHALDTGVKFLREAKPAQFQIVAAKVSKGVAVIKNATVVTTTYQVKNHKNESFNILMDHQVDHQLVSYDVSRKAKITLLENPEAVIEVSNPKKLKDSAVRYSFGLEGGQELLVTITETVLRSEEVIFGDTLSMDWFMKYVAPLGGAFKDNEQVQACIVIQQQIDRIETKIETLQTEQSKLSQKQDRLRKNIATKATGEVADQWTQDLAKAENRITAIDEEEIPELNEEKNKLEQKLGNALKEVVGSWEKS